MNDAIKRYIRNLYYSPREGESLGSVDALYKRIKRDGLHNIRRRDLKQFLQSEEVFTSHQKTNRLPHYAKIIAPHPNFGVEIDSAMMPFPDKNRLKYMIIGIDIFSKKVSAKAVASLKAPVVNRAVNAILDQLGGGFVQIRTDRGSEYFNVLIEATFKRRKMRHFPGFEPTKASYAENIIRVAKRKLYKIMQHKGEHVWSRYLNDVIHGMNHSINRSLGISPAQVTPDKVPGLWFRMAHADLANQPKIRPYEFKIDQTVRIHYSRGQAFRKEYNESTGAQIYYIHERYSPGQNHLYKVRERHGQVLPGRFRPNQLEAVVINADTVWRIDRIVDRRVRNGTREVLIRWLDHGAQDDTWEPAANVRALRARR